MDTPALLITRIARTSLLVLECFYAALYYRHSHKIKSHAWALLQQPVAPNFCAQRKAPAQITVLPPHDQSTWCVWSFQNFNSPSQRNLLPVIDAATYSNGYLSYKELVKPISNQRKIA